MRLLVVEDEEDLADAVVRGLRQEGYAVDVALNGQEGWELADVNDYDLLLLDLNLPDIDGIEICRRLRKTRPHLLILMLTARGSAHQRIAGLDGGADDYLVKPFDFGELVARIRALLRRDMRGRDPVLRYQDITLDPSAHVVWKGTQRLELTKEEQAHIFERFYRVDHSRSRHKGGAGLGLSIVQHILSLHNSSVTLEKSSSMGSTFLVTLPIYIKQKGVMEAITVSID